VKNSATLLFYACQELAYSGNPIQDQKLIVLCCIKSITLYGSKVWEIKERYKQELLAVEIDYWQGSNGKSRLDKVRSEEIREKIILKER
jgi:hypothetical protein